MDISSARFPPEVSLKAMFDSKHQQPGGLHAFCTNGMAQNVQVLNFHCTYLISSMEPKGHSSLKLNAWVCPASHCHVYDCNTTETSFGWGRGWEKSREGSNQDWKQGWHGLSSCWYIIASSITQDLHPSRLPGVVSYLDCIVIVAGAVGWGWPWRKILGWDCSLKRWWPNFSRTGPKLICLQEMQHKAKHFPSWQASLKYHWLPSVLLIGNLLPITFY